VKSFGRFGGRLAAPPFQHPSPRQRMLKSSESLTEILLTIQYSSLTGTPLVLRGHARDGKCLITGLQTQTFSRLKVAHIFPRRNDAEVPGPICLPL